MVYAVCTWLTLLLWHIIVSHVIELTPLHIGSRGQLQYNTPAAGRDGDCLTFKQH